MRKERCDKIPLPPKTVLQELRKTMCKTDIARKYFVSTKTVDRWFKTYNLKRSLKLKLSKEELQHEINLLGVTKVAKKYNVTREYIYYKIRKFAIGKVA